jgi:hypothetical protein
MSEYKELALFASSAIRIHTTGKRVLLIKSLDSGLKSEYRANEFLKDLKRTGLSSLRNSNGIADELL